MSYQGAAHGGTAQDWEAGRVEILIKVYATPPGKATVWLHAQPTPSVVWLSRPMRTLHVPSLSPDEAQRARRHASVLLVLAGTGVVAAPQVLHHTDPATCFGKQVLRAWENALLRKCTFEKMHF